MSHTMRTIVPLKADNSLFYACVIASMVGKTEAREKTISIDENVNWHYNMHRRDACESKVKVDGTAYFLIGGK